MAVIVNDEKKPEKKRWRSDVHRRQRYKNLAVLGVLLAMVVLFYVLSIVRMGGGK